jgi:hypothetical protein
MSEYERAMEWAEIQDWRHQATPVIHAGAVAEVESAITSLEVQRAAVKGARDLEERRWSAKLLNEEKAAFKSQVESILAREPSPMFGEQDRATQLQLLRSQAMRGDEHRRRAVLEVLAEAKLPLSAPFEERQAVHTHVAAPARRDLVELRKTPLMDKTATRAREAEQALLKTMTVLDVAAETLGERNPVGSLFANGPLARAARRVTFDQETGAVTINAPDSVEVTGVGMVDQAAAFESTMGG